MTITIKLATTAQELDEVFKVRYQVFCEEEGYYQENEYHKIVDSFDTYPGTGNIIAISHGKVVGSLRVCQDEPGVGLPADQFFDFRKHLPSDAKIIHGGHFCVLADYRSSEVAAGLVRMAAYYSMNHGATHAALPSNPVYKSLFLKIGYHVIGEAFVDPFSHLPTLPMVMEFAKMNDFFLSFVKQNQLLDFIGDYERCFYDKGEYIIEAGEHADNAYILIDGSADVCLPHTGAKVGQLEPGDVFGELAILTNSPRSAHVIASEKVQLMTLSQEKFNQHLMNSPKKAANLLKLLSLRVQSLLQQLEAKSIQPTSSKS